MTQSIMAQIAALKTAPITELKTQWRALFEREPPPFNRRYIESRLAYRIQELKFGGLKPETIERLEALADEIDADTGKGRRRRLTQSMPAIGTQLVREWRGTEHRVTITVSGFLYDGKPYKSLSAIARGITGTRWNGWTFFGLKNQRSKS